MPLILNIDTATEFASICLSKNGVVISFEENKEQKNHASFLQPAIKRLMGIGNWELGNIDAIAVTNGPGSYTGLRVGLASAKGLCFVLNKPLILLNTLEVMGFASRNAKLGIGNWELVNDEQTKNEKQETRNFLFCPMIDARRMEVFTALYDAELNEILKPTVMILDNNSFKNELTNHQIIFSGSGSFKMRELQLNNNAGFSNIQYSAKDMIALSEKMFENKMFADLAYSSPNYHKEFYTTATKK